MLKVNAESVAAVPGSTYLLKVEDSCNFQFVKLGQLEDILCVKF